MRAQCVPGLPSPPRRPGNEATIYVARSLNFSGIVPANNSFIVHYPSSCSGCQVDFTCYSDSTSSGKGEVVFPDGNAYSSAASLDGGYTVERLQYSTLHVQVSNLYPTLGVFTCKLPDSNGKTIHTSIGVYASPTGEMIIRVLHFAMDMILCQEFWYIIYTLYIYIHRSSRS